MIVESFVKVYSHKIPKLDIKDPVCVKAPVCILLFISISV